MINPFMPCNWTPIYFYQKYWQELLQAPVTLIEHCYQTYPQPCLKLPINLNNETYLGCSFRSDDYYHILHIGPIDYAHYTKIRYKLPKNTEVLINKKTLPPSLLGNFYLDNFIIA